MVANRMSKVIHQLRRVVLARAGDGAADGELLRRFVERRDEAAFAALVERHGPMVLGVCRRTLGNAHDAEDAFQATFLVLVRRAASIRQRERVGNWLYGVGYRMALEARGKIARRRARERPVEDLPHPGAAAAVETLELRACLDQELSRLAEKYRLPLVLCDLEGRSRKQVAQQLHIPEGTLSSRLATARKMLAGRLTRRGLVLSGSGLAVLLAQEAAPAAVPTAVVTATARAAALVATGPAALGSVLPAPVAILTERVLNAMLLTRLKIVTLAVLLFAAGTGFGVGMLTYRAVGAEQASARPARPRPQPAVPRNLAQRLADVEKQLHQVLAEVQELRRELKGKAPAVGDGKVLRLKNASAPDAAALLDKIFNDKKAQQLRIVADPRTNSLIVFGSPQLLADLEKVLKLLDAPE
jgi:RNA polymerase sigma factor (sigma-70 family)